MKKCDICNQVSPSLWQFNETNYCANCLDKIIEDIMTPTRQKDTILNVYKARQRGKEYCETDGSDHYKYQGLEPMDLIMSCGYAEGFCMGSIIKYAARFKKNKNPNDLKKIADYAHIMCGALMDGGK